MPMTFERRPRSSATRPYRWLEVVRGRGRAFSLPSRGTSLWSIPAADFTISVTGQYVMPSPYDRHLPQCTLPPCRMRSRTPRAADSFRFRMCRLTPKRSSASLPRASRSMRPQSRSSSASRPTSGVRGVRLCSPPPPARLPPPTRERARPCLWRRSARLRGNRLCRVSRGASPHRRGFR